MRWPWQGPKWPTRPLTEVFTGHADENGVTAAAVIINNTDAIRAGRRPFIPKYESWQRELWDYYESTGEYGLAVTWRSNMISRVRLRAAEVRTDSDEPMIVDSGPAAELVRELFSDTGSQSEILGTLSVFMDVPGEGWIVGENLGGRSVWKTYSSDELRRQNNSYQVIDENSYVGRVEWRDIASDSLVVRIWRPDKRLRYMPFSPGKAARSALRELDLVNRHIQAQYLSRLASAGIVMLPDEISFPVREEFAEAADPFVAEWIETAREAIQTPGTAAAVIPIPMRVPGEYVDKVKHIDFTMKLDEKIIEKRDSARKQLASQINVPTELLFDAGTLNHWGLWQLEESGVKAYITPDIELIAGALTVGYLRPRLAALGEDPLKHVVWYDASEIITKPDRSESVIKAYDRLEVTGDTMRREIGLSKKDKPTDAELGELILKKLAAHPQIGLLALHELTGIKLELPEVEDSTPREQSNQEPDTTREDEGNVSGEPPDSRDDDPRYEKPREKARQSMDVDRDAFTILQARSQHVLTFDMNGFHLKHPLLCQPKLFSCPFTHVTYEGVGVHPGTHGDYEARLSPTGDLVIGRRIFTSADDYLPTTPWGANGVSVGSMNGHDI